MLVSNNKTCQSSSASHSKKIIRTVKTKTKVTDVYESKRLLNHTHTHCTRKHTHKHIAHAGTHTHTHTQSLNIWKLSHYVYFLRQGGNFNNVCRTLLGVSLQDLTWKVHFAKSSWRVMFSTTHLLCAFNVLIYFATMRPKWFEERDNNNSTTTNNNNNGDFCSIHLPHKVGVQGALW